VNPQRVFVVGDGAWGTALALVLHANGHRVSVWGYLPEQVDTIRRLRENREFLPGVQLPEEVRWTSDASDAGTADVVVLAAPTRFMRGVLQGFRGHVRPDARFVSVAKGLDPSTLQRMSVLAGEVLGLGPVAALSGPSHAEEVARRVPTAVTVACSDAATAVHLQRMFSNAFFRVYTSADVVGVELGGTLKNVIAVGVGVSDGLGFGSNTRAALMTRGLAEMTRLGCAMGSSPATFAGLSGMGDLIVTCTSRLSRNWKVGERIGRGEAVEAVLGSTRQAVEGVWNCAAALRLAATCGVQMPVTVEVNAVLQGGKTPLDAVRSLMLRDVKPEN
jgi:glycerol-3-phosphate dehydrogenase (NAD(P)+)